MCALELYTDRGLRVVRFSAEEARRNGVEEIAPAHLLLALARDALTAPGREPVSFAVSQLPLAEPHSEALRVLGEFDVGPERLAREICRAADLVMPADLRAPGPAGIQGRSYTNSPETVALLKRQLMWASRRSNAHLSTLHALAGLLGDRGSATRAALAGLGVPNLKAIERAAVCTRAERYERDQQMLRLAAANPSLHRVLRMTIPGSTRALMWNRRRLRRELRAQEST